jgi:hypothetical protein
MPVNQHESGSGPAPGPVLEAAPEPAQRSESKQQELEETSPAWLHIPWTLTVDATQEQHNEYFAYYDRLFKAMDPIQFSAYLRINPRDIKSKGGEIERHRAVDCRMRLMTIEEFIQRMLAEDPDYGKSL